MSKIENPPAFPVKVRRNTSSDPLATPHEFQLEGMSLRDWFAGQALAGMLACPTMESGMRNEQYSRVSYAIADAMLAERKRGGAA